MFSFLKKIIYKPVFLNEEQKKYIFQKYSFEEYKEHKNSYIVNEFLKIFFQSIVFSIFMLSLLICNMIASLPFFYGILPVLLLCLLFLPVWNLLAKEFIAPLKFESENFVLDKQDYNQIHTMNFNTKSNLQLGQDKMISSDILFSNMKDKV